MEKKEGWKKRYVRYLLRANTQAKTLPNFQSSSFSEDQKPKSDIETCLSKEN